MLLRSRSSSSEVEPRACAPGSWSYPAVDVPPKLLIETFRTNGEKQAESVSVMLEDEGFDAQTMRLLVAWMYTPHAWKRPRKPCPDEGMATAAAWRWLWSGITLDYAALADAANVTASSARQRMTMLIAARLVFPDGTIAKAARGAMTAAVTSRLPKKKDKDEPKEPKRPAASKPEIN